MKKLETLFAMKKHFYTSTTQQEFFSVLLEFEILIKELNSLNFVDFPETDIV